VSYIESLPPTDELVKVAKLFGFLTLMGQQLPDAIEAERGELRKLFTGAYTAFQQEVKTSQTYHDKLNERLSRLPDEIASGVKPDDIAAVMAERFRRHCQVERLPRLRCWMGVGQPLPWPPVPERDHLPLRLAVLSFQCELS